jgi:peptidyl-prolyl cis-trans isomerase B (cyclophilin B)
MALHPSRNRTNDMSLPIRAFRSIVLALAMLPTAATVGQSPAADLDAIRTEYRSLAEYIRKRQSVGEEERKAAETLAGRLLASLDAGGNDPALLAMAVQLATWSGSEATIDAAYAKILAARPDNDVALSQWLTSLTGRGDGERAVAEASARVSDLIRMPRTAMSVAEAYIALNRFDDAEALLESLGPAAMAREVATRNKPMRIRLPELQQRWAREQGARARDDARGDNPTAVLTTAQGPITIELFEEQAPATVAAFIEFVEGGQYDQSRFHDFVPGVGLYGGDPNTKAGATGRPGTGTAGFRIPDECKRDDRRDAFSGSIVMLKTPDPARANRFQENSASCSFAILVSPGEQLSDEFTVVGRVLDGQELLASLRAGDDLLAARVLRKRPREYRAVRMPELPATGPFGLATRAVASSTGDVSRLNAPINGGTGDPGGGVKGPAAPTAPTAPSTKP